MNEEDLASGVYSAAYSGVQVYEMICRGIAVMRRHSDSWLNATQLLKVAGVEKGRRTKILEREVLTGVHEKIQGGYGKYQGTWVPFARGMQLCKQYGVYEYVRPILEHDPTAAGTRPDKTPTKAEVRRLMKSAQKPPARGGGVLPPSVKRELIAGSDSATKRYKVSSSVATSPLNSDITGIFHPSGLGQGVPSTPAYPHAAELGSVPRTSSLANPLRSAVYSSPAVNYSADAGAMSIGSSWGYHTASEDVSSQTVVETEAGSLSGSSRDKHDRNELMKIFLNDDPNFIPEWLAQVDVAVPCSPLPNGEPPSSSQLSKVNVDLVIDDQGHTAVHWAAALARIQVLDLLLYHGADARLLNYEGESALVRAVQVTNNYENQTFPDLLELLHDTIPLTDKYNRTVLHHIALAAGTEGRDKAARYYADCLLSWIVRLAGGYQVDAAENSESEYAPGNINGSRGAHFELHSSADAKPLERDGSESNLPTPMQGDSPGLQQRLQPASALGGSRDSPLTADAMDDHVVGAENTQPSADSDNVPNADFAAFLNLQDDQGNTALNIAARIGDRAIIRMLLNAGASPTLPNRVGLCPLDFGVDKIAYVNGSDAGLFMSDLLIEEGFSSLQGSSTPLDAVSRKSAGPILDALGSPTPSNRKHSQVAHSSTPLVNGLQPPQTPLRSALRGANKNLLSSLMASRNGGRGHNGGLADGSNSQEVWSPASAELRMHQSVLSIQRLMAELETDFAGEMRIKHEHFDEIKQQLRNTTIELAKARETIHQLQAKTTQLTETRLRVGYLEDTLARETSAVREAINALPSDSKPRRDLEALLKSLLTSPSGDDPFKSVDGELNLPLVPASAFGDEVDENLDELAKDPAKILAAVERLRTVNQVYARRDMLLRERVAALRRRADVSERERQYRQIIASCCEIPEADVDIWIDRLACAVESSDAQHATDAEAQLANGDVFDNHSLAADTSQDTLAARV